MFFKKKILYGDWIWNWLDNKKDYIKESTYANYTNIISNHIIYDLGKYYLSNLNNNILQTYLLNKFKEGRLDGKGGLSGKTVRDIVAVIKSSLKTANKEGLIHNVCLDFIYPKNDSQEKIYVLSLDEQQKLINYVIQNNSIKNMGILLTLYSGIRIGELCALQWKDIDFKNNILHINKTLQRIYIKDNNQKKSKIIITTPKTRNSKRDIPINMQFSKELKKYKTHNEDFLLSCDSKWIEPRTYRRYFANILKDANINKVNFHSLRHTFATNCIKLGIDYKTVSELLGHATVNITLNLYVHPQMYQKKKCIDLICKSFINK